MNRNAQESLKRVSDGEFRHYVFGISELHAETERFLAQVGYELKPADYIGLVRPDFRASCRLLLRRHTVSRSVEYPIPVTAWGLLQRSGRPC